MYSVEIEVENTTRERELVIAELSVLFFYEEWCLPVVLWAWRGSGMEVEEGAGSWVSKGEVWLEEGGESYSTERKER